MMGLWAWSKAGSAWLALIAAGLWLSPAGAGAVPDPSSFPRVVACYGGPIGVGRSGTTVGCSPRDGAYWLYVAEPRDRRKLADVVYRFDVRTGVMESRRIEMLPDEVHERWAFLSSGSQGSGARRGRPTPPNESPLIYDRRVFEVKSRAILVQQGYDYRIHPVPWPEWREVDGWMETLGWGDGTVESIHRQPRPPASPLGPFLRFRDRLYFGLMGGMSEGEGGFGGLAIFDLHDESWEVLRPEQLLHASVSDVVSDPQRRALWLGTRYDGEYGTYPASGLVRFDLDDRSWRGFTPENSDIPGEIVWWLRWSSGGLWVSTERGLGRMNLENESWTNFLWTAPASEAVGSGFALTPTAPPRPAPEATVRTVRPPDAAKGGVGAVVPMTPTSE